jgi:hypothetical protein
MPHCLLVLRPSKPHRLGTTTSCSSHSKADLHGRLWQAPISILGVIDKNDAVLETMSPSGQK